MDPPIEMNAWKAQIRRVVCLEEESFAILQRQSWKFALVTFKESNVKVIFVLNSPSCIVKLYRSPADESVHLRLLNCFKSLRNTYHLRFKLESIVQLLDSLEQNPQDRHILKDFCLDNIETLRDNLVPLLLRYDFTIFCFFSQAVN